MAVIAQFGFLAPAFARQHGIWISAGTMGLVGSFLPAKVHRRIGLCLSTGRRPGRRICFLDGLKTLLRGPGFQQRPIYGKVLVAEQTALGWPLFSSPHTKNTPHPPP